MSIEKMLMFVEKRLFQTSYCYLRKFSAALESTSTSQYENDHHDDEIIQNDQDFTTIRSENAKSLKVAIIGLPSVGKSTLINRLITRPVCATATKFHVTRAKSNAIYSTESTQLVFIDTPGLVSDHEFKKFKLEETFRQDAKQAMESADIVGVVQDTSNKYTRGIIHKRILELVKLTRVGVPSILIMNKVDKVKKKTSLLSLVQSLTGERGWPNFSDVFMVSALNNDGVNDLRNYLLDFAKPRDWDYSPHVITDQPMEKVIERIVRANFLDALPQEITYKKISIAIENLTEGDDNTMHCVVNIYTSCDRISRTVLGPGGRRVKNVALQAEQLLSNAFRMSFRLHIAVQVHKNK